MLFRQHLLNNYENEKERKKERKIKKKKLNGFQKGKCCVLWSFGAAESKRKLASLY